MHKYYENDELHIPKRIQRMNPKQLERRIFLMDLFLKLLPRRQKKKMECNTKFNL